MKFIKFNRENHSLLNQVFDMFAELLNHEKHITLCNVPAHMGIKSNETADKALRSNRYATSYHFKTALYRLLLNHKEGYKLQVANEMGNGH